MFLFKRNFKRKLSGLLIIYLIVLSFGSALLVNIKPVSAEINISLKWTRSAGTGSTYLGPLAVDLNNDGLMEIVITGTSGVAALNPITGSLLWRAPFGGYHSPPEIIDLNKDGTPEVVFCASVINGAAERGVVAIHGNNGSVYWINRNAASGDNYLAVADINADGYPEIYTVQPGKITALTYDGQIFASTYTYYSCWGGLSVGDTNFDGVFEVYLGERSNWYPDDNSPGRGLRAFWADNLTEIWAHPDILCSSQAPVLADVDKDGDLEIIILNQRGGIAVINTDGSVNTYKGIYRKQLNIPGLTAHSNAPVADLDGDGNLELITNGNAAHQLYQPKIWDLVDWKLDATLPFPSDEPPGLADVDGDGKWEIINCNAQNVTIFKYNAVTKSYDIVYTIPLANASPFSIAQDIDNDGKLELVFGVYNTDRIYVYDVEAPAPSPRPRSGLYFYSQYRTRVPEYIPPPGPPAPKITEVSPPDGSTNVPITLSGLSFKLTDFQSDPMNVTVSTSPNIGSISLINVPNNKYTVPISGLAYSTTYTWTVTATDGTHTTTKTFTFTTSDLPPWYNTDWQYRRTIMIDHTKVSGDQTNFPVLMDITDPSLTTKAQPDGDDFVFTDQDNNKLNHQIEYYDNTTGRLIAWVNIPYLSSTTDTKIYLYYGNPTCGNQQNPKAVWDPSYKLVLHLNEKSGTHYDSTAYGNNGTPINGVQQGVNAKIDGGDTFDGTNDYIEIAHSDTLAGYKEALTVSFWIRLEDTGRRQAIINKYNTGTNQRGWFVEYNPVDRPTRPFGFYASPDGANYREWYASFVPAANTWYYVTVVWEANKVPIFYINGVQVPTVGTATISEIYNNVGVPLHIARSTYNSARYFKGSLDEIRISNPARSAGYILTSYNNQLNPSAFYTVSREESLPGEPIISNPNPPKDATNVPITLTELSFTLTDYQHDLMNFTVTTNPDIGSRREYNVESGTYTVSISGLKYAKTYTWTVTVTDGTYTTTKTFKFTVEPAPPADDIIFDSNFDMGNLINVTYIEGRAGYRHYKAATNYTIGYDPVAGRTNNDKHWWFYFSMENAAGKTIAVSIVNGTDSDWSTSQTAGNRWPEIEPVYSYDNINWYRVPLSCVSYDRTAKVFTINITVPPEYDKVWLAPLPPYTIARRNALFAEFADSPYLKVESLGTTPGGQQLLVATITDPAYPDENKFRSYVIAQQHSGEVPASWEAEGLIRFLLSDNPTAAAIRRSFIFRIVPIVNVDGVYYGVSRYTPIRNGYQYDLNRQWSLAASGSTSSYLQPEIKWIWQDLLTFKPHSFNDMHSTINTEVGSPKEALTYSWSTTDSTVIAFRAKLKEGGWPETVTGTTSYACTVIHNSLGIKESVSWENPHDELSTNPGVKLTVYDWMSWGAAWAKGNYLYFGDAQPWLKDPKFDESVDSNDLRANSAGQDWYESRSAFSGGDPTLLTLDINNVGGNTGKKAALKNYGIASNAYLTQEFRTTITGTFTISFDIYIDRIEDNGNYDRVGHIYIGDDRYTADAPTGRSEERFVILAFYDPTPGDTGTDLEIRARTTSGQSWSNTTQWLQVATGLSYDTWYTIKLVVKVASGTYDVYVNGALKMTNIPKYSGYSPTSVLYMTFAADSDARGDFYVDNVYSPAQNRYRLKVTTMGNGSVTVNPSESTYGKGDTVTLNAVPEPGWVFSHWEGNLTGIQNPATITITSNMNITAVFTQGQYTLTVNIIGGGQVQIDPLKAYYTYGEEVNLTAIPYEEYDFAEWSGDLTGTNNPQTLIIDGNKTVTAKFTLKQFTITAQVLGEGGKITPSGTITVFYGQNQTFLITPDIGYHVSDVIADGTSVGSVSSYTFYNINDNHIITAKFALNQYTLTINIIGGGTVSKNPDKHYYTHGETVQITAIPGQDWTFSGWSGPISGLTNPTNITITSNITVSATFTLNNWWNRDWQYRRTITINRTKVSGELTNFPVLIEILDGNLVGKTQQNGEDFVFTDANNVKLDHQIEFYDSATGHLIVWVKVPTLSQTTDTVLYLYYGNPNCGNQQNPTAVWDTSYKLVLHLNEQTGTHYDSTTNANNGTPRNGVQQGVTAKIDGGDYFDGIDDYIEIPHSSTLSGYTEALTISFWVKFEDTSRRQTILGKYNSATNQRGWFVDYNPRDRPTRPLGFYASWDGANYREWYANFVPKAGEWYYITIVWEANAIPRFYINSVQVQTIGTATIPQIYNNVGVPLLIGRCQYDNSRYFKGYLDEITISNPARSANWILTTYNNQLNPSAFYSISPEEQFEEAYVLTITVEGKGTVHINPQKTAYKQGENVTLTAIPDEGYNFAGWSGDVTSQETNITITITKNTFITANFTLKQYIINATVSGTGGKIQPSGLITVYHGENITFTVTPDTGYHIENVIVDNVSQGQIESYTFCCVNANHTIIAFFAPNQYTLIINVSPIEGGTVYANKTAPYYYGDVVELTAVPTLGWSFAYWSGNLTGNQNPAVIIIDGNKTVTAVFTQNQYTLNITIIGNGQVTKDPDKETYTYGKNVTLTATADPGWSFVGWSGDAHGSETTITITINGNKSITATFKQNVYTITIIPDGNGNVTKKPDQQYYLYGEKVELTATPALGWSFDKWGGALSGSINPINLTITENLTIIAYFKQNQYTLTIHIEGSGTVTAYPNQTTYTYGTIVQLHAIPHEGWTFSHWTGDLSGSLNPTNITIDGNKTVTAHFSQNQYTLTIIIVGNGTVAKNPDKAVYAHGEIVTLTAVADPGWKFIGWSGDIERTENPINVTMDSSKTINATFIQEYYTLIIDICGSGTVTIDPLQPTYTYGTQINLTANPSLGWSFSHWSGNISSYDNPLIFTIKGNTNITAHFTQNQYTLVIIIDGQGQVIKNPNQTTYVYGDSVELTAIAENGWQFSHWSGDLEGTEPQKTIIIDGNKNITAHFIQEHYTITIIIVGNGTVTAYPNKSYYLYGETVQLNATADPGWSFSHWEENLTGNENPTTIFMNGNKTVKAVFTQNYYMVTIYIVGEGDVTKSPDKELYTYGETVNLTALPKPGWSFTGWSGCINSTQNPLTITIEANITITATFTYTNQPPQITSPNPPTDPTILEGDDQEFSITLYDPDGDTLLIEWYLNNSLVEVNATTFTFTSNYTSSGTYNITVKVSDGLEQATHQWTLTVLDVGPVLDMPFDTDANPSPDNSGYGNNGTVQGATWTTAGNGSYYFDGVDDYIEIADADSLDGAGLWSEITIEFWVRITSEQTGRRIIAKANSYQVGFQSSQPANTLYFGIWNETSGYYEVEYSTSLQLYVWYHIVCTYKAGEGAKIYINGVQVPVNVTDPETVLGRIRASTTPLEIGRRYDKTNSNFNGLIDDVKIYFKALPESQIVKHYIESKDAHVNTAPIILSYSPENLQPQVVAGGTLQFTHTSIDPERDPLTYTWLLDGTVKANTQSWTYQPTNSEVGFHNVTLVVSDGSLNVKIEWNVTVLENNPPTITAYTPTIDYPCINQGNRQTFTVTASDPDGDPITYEWYLNNNQVSTTDTYTFDATSGASGAHTITIIIKDIHGAQTSRRWYLTVDATLVMPFDTNATPVVDYAGYNNNGTVNGATWTAEGKVGGAYFFDGSDYITIDDHAELGGDGSWTEITIEFWIYLTQDQWGSRIIAKRGATSARSYQVGIQSKSSSEQPNRLYFGVWNRATSPVYYEIEIATPLQKNVWYHVVCTYKSTVGSKIFINGQEVAINVKSGQNTGNIQPSSGQPLYIGRGVGSDGTFTYFIGIIDEVRIYPKSLTAEQIRPLYLQVVSLLEDCSPITVQTGNTGSATNLLATSTLPLIFAVAILSKRKRKIRISQLNPSFFVANINV
jgi:uncharacterized repeat protein (TIGR02543 family)